MLFNYVVFSVSDNYYLYDGVSSNILSIQKKMYDNHQKIFKNLSTGMYKTDMEFKSEYEEIIEAVKNGILIEASNNSFNYWFEEQEFTKDFCNEIRHLMIGVTEKCNLRCKYCVFSGHYPNERTHGTSNIDISTLDNALKYFFKISKSKNKIINFYGGEPLVNFEAIKYATEYVNSVDKSVMIYATTNGTLFDETICNWFIENKNVHFYVSIAGMPFLHDKLRVTYEGHETFNTIKNNLVRLKSKDENAYKSRIHFVFNIFSAYQLFELDEYLNSCGLFNGMEDTNPEVTFIDCNDDDGYVANIGERVSEFYEKKYPIDLLDKYMDLLMKKKHNHLLVKYFDEEFLNVHRRPDLAKNIISGVCKPFVKKIFVDVNGNIHLCENFLTKDYFGNVNSDIKIDKSNDLLANYKKNREKTCKTCWASKMCSLCFKDLFDSNINIDLKRATSLCENERKYIKSLLKSYCYIMEKDNTMLDHLNNYFLSF